MSVYVAAIENAIAANVADQDIEAYRPTPSMEMIADGSNQRADSPILQPIRPAAERKCCFIGERPAGGFLRHRESGLETGFRPKRGARRGTFGRLSPNHSDFANTAEVLIYFVHSVGRKTIPSIKRVCPRIVVQYPQGRLSAAESNIEEILAKP